MGKTIREQIKQQIEQRILPYLKKQDLDYYKVLDGLSADIGASRNMIEAVLRSFINSNKMKEIRTLTLPDEEVGDWLKDITEEEKQQKEEIEKADKFVEDLGNVDAESK
jgi:hypothetical protein